jgi:copper resistance protein C
MDAMGRDRTHTDTQMRPLEKTALSLSVALMLAIADFQTVAQAHAFPVRSDPRVGWTVAISPPIVTIWFDGELEPAFSTITVYNSAKQQVDKGNSRVNGSDASVLEVDLPPLASGTYHVYWKVLAKDTHVTEGDFTFAINKK